MKLSTAKKLKFGDRVFVKHSCRDGLITGRYVEVINHPLYGGGAPVYGDANWVDVSETGSYKNSDDWSSVEIEHLKRVNVLPKDCVAGTKVRIKEDSYSSYQSECGKIVEILGYNTSSKSIYFGYAPVTCGSYGDEKQHVKLSELELYFA